MTVVAVTGARGFVGTSVVAALEEAGIATIPIVRRGRDERDLVCDLRDARSIRALAPRLAGVDALVHLAGHVHRPKETEDERRAFRAVNVEGTAELMRACRDAGVAKVVFVSTIGVYDFEEGIATEDTAPNPRSAYAASKLEAEQVVRSAFPRAVVARLATVYGRGDRANFARLADAVRRRRFVIPGDGSARKSVIAVQDAGAVLASLATLDAAPTLLNVAAPDAPTLEDCCASLALAFGVPTPRRVPRAALELAGRLGDSMALLGLGVPLDSSTVAKLARDSVVDVTRLGRTLREHRFRRFVDEAARAYGAPR